MAIVVLVGTYPLYLAAGPLRYDERIALALRYLDTNCLYIFKNNAAFVSNNII